MRSEMPWVPRPGCSGYLKQANTFVWEAVKVQRRMCVSLPPPTRVTRIYAKRQIQEDLYYRLNTVPIRVPALRDRQEDILSCSANSPSTLPNAIKTTPVQLTDDARHLLIQYPWYGNVRELKNIAEQISVLEQGKTINADQLRAYLPEQQYADYQLWPDRAATFLIRIR